MARLCCCFTKKASRYRKLLKKAKSTLKKELDLQKFIVRQRAAMTSNIAVLTGHQKSFVDKFSQLTIRESSDLMDMTSETDLSDWKRENMNFVSKIERSKEICDKRFIHLYKLRRAETRKSIADITKEELQE